MRPPAYFLIWLALACFGCASLVTVIPADAMTDTRITVTRVRIEMYAKEHGGLPASLDPLPARQGYDNETTDGWGRPINYSRGKDTFSLSSLGKDGLEGGSGDDADIVKTFRIVDGTVTEANP